MSGGRIVTVEGGSKAPFGDPKAMEQLLEVYLGAVRATVDQIASGGAGAGAPDATERLILMQLARAQAMTMNRGLKLWRQISEAMIDYGAATRAAREATPDEEARRAALLQSASECLRRIGELSQSNAAEFQQELKDIEAALAAAGEGDEAS